MLNDEKRTVEESYCSATQSSDLRVEAVCKRLGWKASTLQKKISLTTDTHHLSIAELQMLQHVTGDISPTQALAAHLRTLAPVPPPEVR